MTSGPVSPDPGRDDDPAWRAGETGHGTPDAWEEPPDEGWWEPPASTEDCLTEEEWTGWLASMPEPEDP
ncbi:MAG TPA: hypothetical protein VHO07_14065, partial [Streptosporangiaceae bacterium]|nr:hypothetical protein [Streptosporangiaceae bacterium]